MKGRSCISFDAASFLWDAAGNRIQNFGGNLYVKSIN